MWHPLSTRVERSARELFRPEKDWAPAYACALLFFVIVFVRECAGSFLLAALIALSIMAGRDVLTANWLWRRDPDRARARACFCFCLSRGTLKLTAAATILSLIPYQPLGWHERIGWGPPTALLAGIGAHAGFAVAGYFLAMRSGVRIWIDSGLHHSRRRSVWPPRCLGTTNQPTRIWPTAIACAVIVLVFGFDPLAHAFSEYGLAVGGAIIGLAAGMMGWTAKAGAATPEECWYRRAA